MKKHIYIFFILLFSITLIKGCSSSTNENITLELNVTSYSDKELIVKDSNTTYKIPNSNIKIIDKYNKKLSWNDLKDSKLIKIYYSGEIIEINPPEFKDITKITILN